MKIEIEINLAVEEAEYFEVAAYPFIKKNEAGQVSKDIKAADKKAAIVKRLSMIAERHYANGLEQIQIDAAKAEAKKAFESKKIAKP